MYVFDNNTLSAIFRHYYVDRFPSFWNKFNQYIEDKKIISVKEVRRELEELNRADSLQNWIKLHTDFFEDPNLEELKFITEIYKIQHFQQNLERKKLIKGGAFADPFLIAKAKIKNYILVTQEKEQPHAVKIPNICKNFDINCIDLEGFLIKENWSF